MSKVIGYHEHVSNLFNHGVNTLFSKRLSKCENIFILIFFFSTLFDLFSFSQDEALNNITKSTLNFVPTTDDDGKSITCRAENPKVPGLFLETTWRIEVICKLSLIYKSIQQHARTHS